MGGNIRLTLTMVGSGSRSRVPAHYSSWQHWQCTSPGKIIWKHLCGTFRPWAPPSTTNFWSSRGGTYGCRFMPSHRIRWMAEVSFQHQGTGGIVHPTTGMVQAWVAHHVMPTTPPWGYFLVLVYIRRVTTTRQDRNTQHKHTANTTTMVVEPSTPLAEWFWWIHAAQGVGSLS
jgi:hypothetical protein